MACTIHVPLSTFHDPYSVCVPSGRVHNLINIAAYSVLAAGVLYAVKTNMVVVTPVQTLNFTLGFMAGTFLLSPDLDLSEGRVDSKRHWGILGFLWIPYGMIFCHRGLSHTWILGPLTRLAYMAVMIAIIVGLIRSFAPEVQLPQIPQPISLKFLVPIIAGYYLSQWLHLLADGVYPDHGMRHGYKKVQKANQTIKRHF